MLEEDTTPHQASRRYYNRILKSHKRTRAVDAGSENIRFQIKLHAGRIEYSVSELVPLLKMVPPNRNVDYQIHSLPGYEFVNVDICNAQRGMQYLVLKGLETCAEYEVTLVQVAAEECQDLVHQCLEDCSVLCTELGTDHYEYQMCEANEWKDFKFQVTEEDLLHSLNVEVSTGFGTANARDFEAIGLYMWKGRLPTDRSRGDLMALYSAEQSFVISVSAHDLQTGWYYYAVKCGAQATHFRVLATLPQAVMRDGDAARRTVCPGNWAYHMVQVGDGNSTEVDEDDGSGHRKLRSVSAPATPSVATNTTGLIEEVVIQTYGHARCVKFQLRNTRLRTKPTTQALCARNCTASHQQQSQLKWAFGRLVTHYAGVTHQSKYGTVQGGTVHTGDGILI